MPEDLSKLIKTLQKNLGGSATITNLSEVETPFKKRLPTGIMSLDMALKGGFPAGSLNQLFGPDGSGKDYLTNRVMAEVQKKHGDKSNIFWMSFGYKPDKEFMRMAGVKIERSDEELEMLGIDPAEATPEQRGESQGNLLFIDVSETKLAGENPAETLLNGVLGLLASNKFQLGIINELGSGETKDNVAKSLEKDPKIATWANLMTKFCQKFYSVMRQRVEGKINETCVIVVNPVRANMDMMSSRFNPWTQGGGYALKHAKAIDLHIKPAGFIRQGGKGGSKVGKDIAWKIMKGKHGVSEGAEGRYAFMFNAGVDQIKDLANTAKAVGTIRNAGAYYYILDYEDRITGGLEGVIDILRESPKLAEELRRETLEKANDL